MFPMCGSCSDPRGERPSGVMRPWPAGHAVSAVRKVLQRRTSSRDGALAPFLVPWANLPIVLSLPLLGFFSGFLCWILLCGYNCFSIWGPCSGHHSGGDLCPGTTFASPRQSNRLGVSICKGVIPLVLLGMLGLLVSTCNWARGLLPQLEPLRLRALPADTTEIRSSEICFIQLSKGNPFWS